MKIKYLLAAVIIVAVLAFGGCVQTKNSSNPIDKNASINDNNSDRNSFNDSNQTGGNDVIEEKFSGKISKISFECASDGLCYAIIGGKYVVFGEGLRPLADGEKPKPWGQTIGFGQWGQIDNDPKYIGKTAEVFAAKSEFSTGYTIHGKKEYYIKLVDSKSPVDKNAFNDTNKGIGGNDVVEEKFSGKVTSVNFGCAVDASCNLTVDGKKYVHFGHDTRGEKETEWGNADELWKLWQGDAKQGVGKTVEVFAAVIQIEYGENSPPANPDDIQGKSYTIQGKKEYYIKVVD